MLSKAVMAVVVAVVTGLLLVALLGPLLVTIHVPVALGLLAGLWYFFAGPASPWPRRPSA